MSVYFVVKKRYTDYEISYLHTLLERWVPDAMKRASLLAGVFMGRKSGCTIKKDTSLTYMAGIDLSDNTIYVNYDRIVENLFASLPFIFKHKDVFDFLFCKNDYDDVIDIDLLCYYFCCYLMLHEIGHYLYTLPLKEINLDALPIIAQMNLPLSFVKVSHNMVEDSFLQRRLQLDYPVRSYRDVFLLGTTIVQGALAKEDFKCLLTEKPVLSIRDKLFYLILRSYNRNDQEVMSMFNQDDKIGWTDEVLEKFDNAICILDSYDRAHYVNYELIPAMFDVLHEVVKGGGPTTSGSDESLLDEDKLREVENDEDNSGNPNSDKPEDPNGTPSNCSGQQGGDSSDTDGDEDDESSDTDGEDGDESSDFDEDEEGDESSGASGDEDDDEDEDESSAGGDTDADDDDDDESSSDNSDGSSDDGSDDNNIDTHNGDGVSSGSEDESSSNDSSSSDSDNEPDGSDGNDGEDEEAKFNQELSDACDELNSSLDESNKEDVRNATEEDLKSLKDNADKVSSQDVSDFLNKIDKKDLLDEKSLLSKASLNSYSSSLSDRSIDLYNNASTLFKRIYTYDTDDRTYLDSGEIDEDIMVDFFTEKSLNIFKEHKDLVESKRIKVIFLVDDSGSMGENDRRGKCRAIVPPLIQAFEDSGIQCRLYYFGSRVALVKDFEDRSIIAGKASNVYEAIVRTDVGCSTQVCPALKSLCDYDYDPEEIYILYTITDGAFDEEDKAGLLYEYLRKERDVNLFGVTIDDSYGKALLLKCMFGNEMNDYLDCVGNYTSTELVEKLPQDIYNTILDKFIIK